MENKLDLEGYKKQLIDRAKSDKTIKNYLVWIKEYYKNFSTLSRQNILEYKKLLKAKNNKSETINLKLIALKNYNEYLKSINKLQEIYIISEDFINIQKKEINPAKYDNKDVEKVIKKIVNSNSQFMKRDLTLVYFLSNTGIRRSEAINAKISDIDFENGIFRVVNGKGGKDGDVYLHDDLLKIIKDYIKTERNQSDFKDSEYLFITQRSKKMSEETVNKIVNKYGEINPHQFRHVWATNAYKNGLGIPEIRNQLRHKNSLTTEIYINPTLKDMRKKMGTVAIGF